MINKYSSCCVLLTALALQIQCGGGGGGSAAPAAPPAPAAPVTPVAPVLTAQPQNQTVTAPAAATFTVAATGTPTPNYLWYLNGVALANATEASYTTDPTILAQNGANYTVAVSNGVGAPVLSNPAILTVQGPAGAPPAAPAISVQPQNQAVLAPAAASFSVTATGTPSPTFQWSVDGVAIPNATGAFYTTGATTLAQNGSSYTVTVSNSAGATVTSSPAVLTVQAPQAGTASVPVITTQPQGQSVVAPAIASFSVSATGTPSPTFTWRLNGVEIPNATGDVYTTGATTLAQNGSSYTVEVSNGVGAPVLSTPAILTVQSPAGNPSTAPVITVQPVNVTVNAPGTAIFTVAATGTPSPTFQWRGVGGVDIPNATGDVYTTDATTLAQNGTTYTVKVSNSAGAVVSEPAVLTVQIPAGNPPAAPVITSQPENLTVVAPGTATFKVKASGTPSPTFNWMVDGELIPGANADTYTTNVPDGTMNGFSYTVSVVNGVGAPVVSTPAILTVNARPVITTQPVATSYAVPGGTETFTVAATGNGPLTYQWYRWSLGWSAIPGATDATYTTPPSAAVVGLATRTYKYSVIVTNSFGTAESTDALWFVGEGPFITAQPSSQTVVAPAPATFTVNAVGNLLLYTWYVDGVAIPGASSPAYTIPVTSTSMSGKSYTVTITSPYNPSRTSTPAILTVNPAPGS